MRPFVTLLAILAMICITAHAQGGGGDRLYLSGTGSDDTRTWDFRCSSSQHAGRWGKIAVPSCWELQGYGDYTYGRFYKTKGLRPSDETGRYRTHFTIPRAWQGRHLRLTFEGVMTDAQVWIDGQQVGPIHQGAFTEFAYDITPLTTPGRRQTLEVLVSKESANASVNSAERRADWWLFGGIYRPVYIDAMPTEHIDDLAIDARADGDLYLRASHPAEELDVTLDGRPIPYDPVAGCYHCAPVTTWDPEHPRLHTVQVSLRSSGHTVTRRVGFRTLEFRPHDGIYLNGTRLVVKGTNRHCFHPESGRTTSRALSWQDARLMKQMNMNAVRCHYPSDRHFLEVCDSIGLLYLDELPGWQTRYDDTTALRIVGEMVRRDVSHPCVFLWSNGNEGGWNKTIDHVFAELDPQQRRVIHPWADYDGIDTHHYPAYQTGAYRLHQGQQVFMPTEFLHGKYDKGQGAGLADMWSHWTASPRFAGGFIWAYIDEAVRRTDLGGLLDSDGGNGPDGVMDPYRQPEASFYTIREVWSPIHIAVQPAPVSPPPAIGADAAAAGRAWRCLIENRWLMTRLGECAMTYRALSQQGAVVAEGHVALPDIAPGERAWATFTLPADLSEADILELTASGPDRQAVCTRTWPLHRADEQLAALTARRDAATQGQTDGSTDKAISHGHRPRWPQDGPQVTFSEQGLIERITAHGRTLALSGGPLPVGMLAECQRHTERTEADGTRVTTFWYRGGIDSIEWRLTPDGRLWMDAVILNDDRGHGYQGQFLTAEGGWQIGLTFDYPESTFLPTDGAEPLSITWLGRGPYRVWRNRQEGQQFGVWQKQYNNTVTGQYNSTQPPVYPEFKGYHADVRWMQLPDMRVTALTEALFVRLYTPREAIDQTPGEMLGAHTETEPTAQPRGERTMIDPPTGDLSFLLSIPPMRSYKPLEQLGPSAQPDVIRIKPGDEGFRIRLMFEF